MEDIHLICLFLYATIHYYHYLLKFKSLSSPSFLIVLNQKSPKMSEEIVDQAVRNKVIAAIGRQISADLTNKIEQS